MRKRSYGDTIAAISTPVGEGGIGIVRLNGPRAIAIADSIFKSKDGKNFSGFKTHTVHYGHIIKRTAAGGRGPGTSPEIIDEVLLTVMKAPKTYTREDIVEINCHGGIQAMKAVLEASLKSGARMAEPGEFTKRAFLNGRLDLAQAEAVSDVIRAKTESSLNTALSQLDGELSRLVNGLADSMLEIVSEIEASIDFPEEEIAASSKKELLKKTEGVIVVLKRLVDSYKEGLILREGILAIICGKPNVGKSSLMNLLLKRDRVIVSPIPGTTRDTVEEMISLKGIPIRLVDTAGMGMPKDALEKEGMMRSKKTAKLADIALVMLDNSSELDRMDAEILKMTERKKRIIIINKSDLKRRMDMKKLKALAKDSSIIEISVEKRKNIDLLESSIAGLIWKGGFEQNEGAVVSSLRHKELLDKSLDHMLSVERGIARGLSPELIAVDLKEAAFNVGSITGRSVSDDILERIFERFCIGK